MNSGHWLTRRSIPTIKTAFVLFALLALGTSAVWAQSVSTGNISGQVVDEQNAAVAGAAVKITDTAINATLSTTTNDAGRYVISNIVPGNYNVSVAKPGFSTFEINGQAVEVGASLVINASLNFRART
jgi:hypothetical protein